jgi:hypothetical protein
LQERAQLTAPNEPWNAALDIGVAGVPTYDAAESHSARPVPMVVINYRDLPFLGATGLGADIVHLQGFRLGPALAFGGRF